MTPAQLNAKIGVIAPRTVTKAWLLFPTLRQRNGHAVQYRVLANHARPTGVVYFTSAAVAALRRDGITLVPGEPLRYVPLDYPLAQNLQSAAPVGWAAMGASPFDSEGRIPAPADEVTYSRTASAATILAQQGGSTRA